LKEKFNERVDYLTKKYFETLLNDFMNLEEEIKDEITIKPQQIGFCRQFFLLLFRGYVNKFRNPFDIKMKIFTTININIMLMILFGTFTFDFNEKYYVKFSEQETNFVDIQNRNGALFVIAFLTVFTAFNNSLAIFLEEKPLFIRESLNNTYRSSAYFWARSLNELAEYIIMPAIIGLMCYAPLGFQLEEEHFKKFMYVMVAAYFTGSGYGFILSTLVNSLELAMAISPSVFVPLLIMGGLYVNQNSISVYFKVFEYISPFKYAFAATAINEFEGLTFNCGRIKFDCDPLKQHEFEQTYWECLYWLIGLSIVSRIISFKFLQKLSTPKTVRLSQH